jgi:WD40 repeat protein
MSPEQALARRAIIDHRTDIYSLGATLYELLTLEPAFPGEERQDVLRRIAQEDPPAPRRLAAAVPMDLETIVLKAMAKEPLERYTTARDLADDLRRFLEDRPIEARRPSLGQRARRWARRHRQWVIGLGAASVVLLAGLIVGLAGYAVEQGQLAEEKGRLADEKSRLADAKSRLADDKEHTRRQAEAKLYRTLLKHAHAVRLARQPGYRAEVWRDLRQAAALDVPERDPRAIAAEALACLGDPIGLDPVPTHGITRVIAPPVPATFLEVLAKRSLLPVSGMVPDPARRFIAVARNNSVMLLHADGSMVGPPWQSPFGAVYDLAFDREGTLLAAGCESGFAVLDVPAGTPRALARGGNTFGVALHPDGRLVATVGRQIELWSCTSGRLVATLPLPKEGAKAQFSADGRLLLAVAGSQPIAAWPVRDTPEKQRFDGHTDATPALAYSPDGCLLASVSKDRTVKIWHAGGMRGGQSSCLLHTCRGHPAAVEAVAFGPYGLLATGDFQGVVCLWNAASGKQLTRFSDTKGPPGQLWRLQFDPTGKWLAAAGSRGVAVWAVVERSGGVDLERWATLRAEAYDLAIRPDGSDLVFLSRTGLRKTPRLFSYNLVRRDRAEQLHVTPKMQLRALNFDPSGRLLTYVTADGRLGRLDWETKSAASTSDQTAFQVALSPGGRWAATTTPDRGVVLYDFDAGKRLLSLPPEDSDIWGLAWAPDGRHLAACLSDGGVIVWDLQLVRASLKEFGTILP